jgi:parallel beta-helix repeat protein
MKAFFTICMLLPALSWAGTTYVASTASEIQTYSNLLNAGDTLLVSDGQYDMNWNIQNRIGTATEWIIIETMGSDAVINGIGYDNVIDVYNCHFIELRGFEITNSYSASGIDGIKFRTNTDHFLMEGLHIHDVTGVGISANPAGESFTYLTVRYCHIHDITGVGEGLYIGNHDGLATVHHCIVEFNWIHDCHPRKGIQFKRGTYLNEISDNVVYNCDEAGIVLYKTDQSSSADNNIIQRNVVWNAPEGIFAVGQTNIDNNVIFDCSYGINVRNYGGWGMEDLFVRNNTIYLCGTTCLRLDDWNNASGQMVASNNACFQDSISRSAIQAPDGIGSGIVSNNRHYGQSQVGGGSTLGKPPSQEFENPSILPGIVDLYPLQTSSFIDSGTSANGAPTDDFNWTSRPSGGEWDVGAYEWSGQGNPGWQIQEDFKEVYTGIPEEEGLRSGQTDYFLLRPVLFFTCLEPGSRVEVFSISGRCLKRSQPIIGSSYRCSFGGLSSGVYFYRIQGPGEREVQNGKIVLIRGGAQ